MRLRCDDCRCTALHHSHSVRSVRPPRLSTPYLDCQLLIFSSRVRIRPNGGSSARNTGHVVHMVGSLLSFQYPLALSSPLSPTVTILRRSYVVNSALVTLTAVDLLSVSVIVSFRTSGLTQDASTQTAPPSSAVSLDLPLCLPYALLPPADASTQLSISEFLELCFTKHPFRRTVPLQLDEEISVTHMFPATQVTRAVFR